MIDLFFNILKKSMVAVVFVIFAFAATYIPQPHSHLNPVETVHAGPAHDPIDFPFDIKNAVETTIDTLNGAWIFLKENALDGIAWAIAKQIISNMISSLVDWINSGFQGSPVFIQDLEKFLLSAADQAVGEYINELGDLGSFICSPFRLDVQLAIALEYDLNRERNEAACTLTGIINNFEQAIEGATPNGTSWDDFLLLTSRPQHTPYGSILTAKAEYRARAINAEGEELSLLGFGDGFLSIDLCQSAAGPNGDQEDCIITKPGKIIQEALTFNLDSGRQTLVEADEFNEIIVALIGQIAQQAIQGTAGLLGLSNGTGYTYDRGSTFFNEVSSSGAVATNPNGLRSGVGTQTQPGAGASTNPGVASAQNLISQGLQAQQTVLSGIGGYITQLDNYIANPLNDSDNIAVAQQARTEANNILTRVSNDVNTLTPLVTQFDALEVQASTATPQELTQIRNQQTVLIQQYSALNLITTQEYSIYTSQWDTILATNVGSPTSIPGGGTPIVLP